MSLKAFKRPSSSDGDINVLSQAVSDFTRPLVLNPMLDGRHIIGVAVSTGVTAVNHGLNRDWVGYVVINNNAAAFVYTANENNKNITLNLTATASGVVDLWVF